MNCRILQGTVFDRLPEIEPGSIDCACASPPYWKLRKYIPDGHPLKALELGQEPTPQEYVANAVRWCGLVRDCLADHGTLWLNVGDTYSQSGAGAAGKELAWQGDTIRDRKAKKAPGLDAGQLCLIPQRLMIALQDDGWIVRSVVVWHKPSCMPASLTGWLWKRCRVKVSAGVCGVRRDKGIDRPGGQVQIAHREGSFDKPHGTEWEDCPGCKKCEKTDGYVLRRGSWRPTSSYEPVIMLAKTANYFCDGEAVKTPPAPATVERDKSSRIIDDPDEQFAVAHDHETVCDSGANLRDVWSIPFEPLTAGVCDACGHIVENVSALRKRRGCPKCPKCGGDFGSHYAAFPSELAHRCLAAGTSQEGYCDKCSAPFVRAVEHKNSVIRRSDWGERAGNRTASSVPLEAGAETQTVGWKASCKCADPAPRPGRALDPFCGSGRTGIVARRLGLDFVGVELNPKFVALATWLLKRDQPLFNDFG